MSVFKRALLVGIGSGTLYAASMGCGPDIPDKITFAGQSGMMQSNVQVNFQDAWAEEDEFKVKLWVGNLSQQVMYLNRQGIALRLVDGRVLNNKDDDHDPINMAPGSGHDIEAEFEDKGHDMRNLVGGSVIVGGIWFGNDPRQRVVGEIPMMRGAAKKDD